MSKPIAICRAIMLCFMLLLVKATALSLGSASKPYEKQKVCVFGAGGYLGGCIFGFLQRCGSLYGTGVNGIVGPRAIVATSTGSVNLNSILSKNFILAQADESFVRLTNMASVDSIQSKLDGFDAAFLSTRYTLQTRPVTMGSYEKGPNDKTIEFFMDMPSSSTYQVYDDPEYSFELFLSSLEASRKAGIKRLIVIETDNQFENSPIIGDKYFDALNSCGIPYAYLRPNGQLENCPGYTFSKGVQGELLLKGGYSLDPPSSAEVLYREDLAAVAVQSLMSLDWKSSTVINVECTGRISNGQSRPASNEWCANSESLKVLLE